MKRTFFDPYKRYFVPLEDRKGEETHLVECYCLPVKDGQFYSYDDVFFLVPLNEKKYGRRVVVTDNFEKLLEHNYIIKKRYDTYKIEKRIMREPLSNAYTEYIGEFVVENRGFIKFIIDIN
jgi:hypothetical protein